MFFKFVLIISTQKFIIFYYTQIPKKKKITCLYLFRMIVLEYKKTKNISPNLHHQKVPEMIFNGSQYVTRPYTGMHTFK